MVMINREKILTGTPQKAFDAGRKKLEDSFTENAAEEFKKTYEHQPLSFLLKNSRDIFSEPYFGAAFYEDVIENGFLNPLSYQEEFHKVSVFIEEAKRKKLPEQQLAIYESVRDVLDKKIKQHKNLIDVVARSETHNAGPFHTCFFDSVQDAEATEDPLYIKKISCEVFDLKDPYTKIPLGYLLARRHKECTPQLMEAIRLPFSPVSLQTSDGLKTALRTSKCMHKMLGDPEVSETLADLPNSDIYWKWKEYASPEHFQSLTQDVTLPDFSEAALDFVPNGVDVLEYFMETMEDPRLEENILISRYDNLDRKRIEQEVYLEEALEDRLLYNTDNTKFVEQCEDFISEIESQMFYMEWEDNGIPNSVIRKRIKTKRDEEKRALTELHKMNSVNGTVKKDVKEEEEKEGTVEDAIDTIDSVIYRLEHFKPKTEEEKERFLKEARVEKEKLEKRYKALIDDSEPLKKKWEELEDAFTSQEFLEEGLDDAIFHDIFFTEASTEKPKRSLTEKIQDKAMDKEARDTEKLEKRSENLQNLKNAANAVSSAPRRVVSDISAFFKDIGKWDENRRKEFMLKPGFRHKLFKKFRLALMYGTAFNLKPSLVPVLWVFRHFSKSKDKRIRNELSLELENEIKICEEKINDANSAGDNKQKYQLMRIRDKLNAERIRIRTNSKYI